MLVNAVPMVEPGHEESPLEAARARRGLTRDEAAARAALSPDEVVWLEEGRLYRFRTSQQAIAALVTYAASLGIDHREALELAGRPVPPLDPRKARPRLLAACAVALVLVLLGVAVAAPRAGRDAPAADGLAGAQLPPPWRVKVLVLNGSGDRNHTGRVADRINALAYDVQRVARADRFDYPETAVYYPRGGELLALRLGKALCAPTKPLPAGNDKRRLVVIVGPARVGGCERS